MRHDAVGRPPQRLLLKAAYFVDNRSQAAPVSLQRPLLCLFVALPRWPPIAPAVAASSQDSPVHWASPTLSDSQFVLLARPPATPAPGPGQPGGSNAPCARRLLLGDRAASNSEQRAPEPHRGAAAEAQPTAFPPAGNAGLH